MQMKIQILESIH